MWQGPGGGPGWHREWQSSVCYLATSKPSLGFPLRVTRVPPPGLDPLPALAAAACALPRAEGQPGRVAGCSSLSFTPRFAHGCQPGLLLFLCSQVLCKAKSRHGELCPHLSVGLGVMPGSAGAGWGPSSAALTQPGSCQPVMDGCRVLFCSINNVLGKLQTRPGALNFNLILSRGLVVLQEVGFGVVCLSSWPSRSRGELCEVTGEKGIFGKPFLAGEWVSGDSCLAVVAAPFFQAAREVSDGAVTLQQCWKCSPASLVFCCLPSPPCA